jgi:hypothetical protein
MVNGKFAIVTGGLSLDYQHQYFDTIDSKCKDNIWAEIHPVFAMFIHVKNPVKDDRWAFFVKTFAEDAGGVGFNKLRRQDTTDLPGLPAGNMDEISVIIPQPQTGFTYKPSVAKQNTWFGQMGDNSTGCNEIFPASISSSPDSSVTSESIPGQGLQLTFKNLSNAPCTERNYYAGEVSIKWGTDKEINKAAGTLKFVPRKDGCTNCCSHLAR